MELKQVFQKTLNESVNMALATSVDNQPNVRIVTFGFDGAQEGKLYFSTFKGNRKIGEFEKNPQVACVMLPSGTEHPAQVRIFGKVQKSQQPVGDLVALLEKKAPEDAGMLAENSGMLEVYEVIFTEAWLTVGMNEAQKYTVEG